MHARRPFRKPIRASADDKFRRKNRSPRAPGSPRSEAASPEPPRSAHKSRFCAEKKLIQRVVAADRSGSQRIAKCTPFFVDHIQIGRQIGSVQIFARPLRSFRENIPVAKRPARAADVSCFKPLTRPLGKRPGGSEVALHFRGPMIKVETERFFMR